MGEEIWICFKSTKLKHELFKGSKLNPIKNRFNNLIVTASWLRARVSVEI